ncbi:hypothetical protein Tco_0569600 [Tanacetum coccineum]
MAAACNAVLPPGHSLSNGHSISSEDDYNILMEATAFVARLNKYESCACFGKEPCTMSSAIMDQSVTGVWSRTYGYPLDRLLAELESDKAGSVLAFLSDALDRALKVPGEDEEAEKLVRRLKAEAKLKHMQH